MTFKFFAILTACSLLSGAASAGTLGAVRSDVGKVIVAAKTGMTLYTFRNDAGSVSSCYGGCAEAWPPFLASASAKANGSLGLTERTDGTRQWTLQGKPLYFWQGDSAVGDATGDGVGGVWDAVKSN